MKPDPKAIQQIEIFRNDEPVGTLARTNDGCRISFAKKFRQDHKHLAFRIPTDKQTIDYKGANLPPYFAGLLPEGLKLKALIRKLKTSPDDLFSLLLASGNESIGDIHFKSEISNLVLNDIPRNFESVRSQLKKGVDPGRNSLAGIQDKISADRLSFPINVKKKSKSYILKLSSSEFPDVIANEFACLKLAKLCKLKVNEAQIVHDEENQPALLVERFDRLWSKQTKSWVRFHQEDACQFLDRYPSDKYLISFQEIANEIAKLATSPEIEILNLMRQKAFSYLVGNGDLHAKNISLMQAFDDDIVCLTPAYDVVCTALYGDQKMALHFLGKNENLKKKSFVDFGLRYKIPEAATVSMLDKLTGLFSANFEQVFSFPLARKKINFLKQFIRHRLEHLEK